VGAVDNPEVFIAGGEVKDLLIGWQDNER